MKVKYLNFNSTWSKVLEGGVGCGVSRWEVGIDNLNLNMNEKGENLIIFLHIFGKKGFKIIFIK